MNPEQRIAMLQSRIEKLEALMKEKIEEFECGIYGHGYEIDQRLDRLEERTFAIDSEMPELKELD